MRGEVHILVYCPIDTLQWGQTHSDGEDYTGHLKLTGCNITRQFTCDDGQCVTMEQRCNQHPDCRDRSDEQNCKVLGEGYNRNVPPAPVDNKLMFQTYAHDSQCISDLKKYPFDTQICYIKMARAPLTRRL